MSVAGSIRNLYACAGGNPFVIRLAMAWKENMFRKEYGFAAGSLLYKSARAKHSYASGISRLFQCAGCSFSDLTDALILFATL